MSEKKKKKKDNPYVSSQLCMAYREHLETKINEIKTTLKIVGVSITFVLAIVELAINLWLR